jgi:hypothetical protein
MNTIAAAAASAAFTFPISNPRSQFPSLIESPKRRRFEIRFSASKKKKNRKVMEKGVGLVRSVLAGGDWWSLGEDVSNVEIKEAATPITVVFALHRMWELIADDRWLIFVAFGALLIAAVRVVNYCSVLLLKNALNF